MISWVVSHWLLLVMGAAGAYIATSLVFPCLVSHNWKKILGKFECKRCGKKL